MANILRSSRPRISLKGHSPSSTPPCPLFSQDYALKVLPLYQSKVRTFCELPAMTDYMFSDHYEPDAEAVAKMTEREGIAGLLSGIALPSRCGQSLAGGSN